MHEFNTVMITHTVENKESKVLRITGKSASVATTCMQILLIEEESIHCESTVIM